MLKNPGYDSKRRRALASLDPGSLDPPMVELVHGYNRLPHCYTLQSCHGHIIPSMKGGAGPVKRLPVDQPPARACYQLAYLALVIENSPRGKGLLHSLGLAAPANHSFIQLGGADWFWHDQGQVNSYVVQVSPQRFKGFDRFEMERPEALQWKQAREDFLAGLEGVLQKELALRASP
jgi:hypothetical protein